MSQLAHFTFRFMTAAIFVTYFTLYGPLPAARVFPLFTFFDIIAFTLMDDVAWFVQSWLDVGVSVRRIEVSSRSRLQGPLRPT